MKTLKSVLFAFLIVMASNVNAIIVTTPDTEAIGLTDAFRDAPSFLALVADQINGYSGALWSPSEVPSQDNGNYVQVSYTPTDLGDLKRRVASHMLTLPVANPNERVQASLRYFRKVKNQHGGYNWETIFEGWQDVAPVQNAEGKWVLPEVKIKMRLSGDPSLPLPPNLSSLKIIERDEDGNIARTYYPPISWESGRANARLSAYYAETEGLRGEIILSYWFRDQLHTVVFDLATKDRKSAVSVSGGVIRAEFDEIIIIENDDVVITFPQGGRVRAIQLVVPESRAVKFNVQAQTASGLEWPKYRARTNVNPVWGPWQDSILNEPINADAGVYWLDLEFPTYGKGLPPRYSPPQEERGGKGGGGGGGTTTVPAEPKG